MRNQHSPQSHHGDLLVARVGLQIILSEIPRGTLYLNSLNQTRPWILIDYEYRGISKFVDI